MQEFNDWVKKAQVDLKSAKILTNDDETLHNAAFYTHQCAEKTFKAFLVYMGKPIPKTHDLQSLLKSCSDLDESFLLIENQCNALNPYGPNSLYPDDYFSVDRQDVEEAIVMAEKIFKFVRKKLQQQEINLSLETLKK